MTDWVPPIWSKQRQEQFETTDPYDFEAKDAARHGRKVHPRSGAGPFKKLDSSGSEFGDFAVDNKRTERKSYGVRRDYWFDRRDQARVQGRHFQESLLFLDTRYPEGHERRELHLIVVEAKVLDELMKGMHEGYNDST